jgi:hypothetical protein
MRGEGSNFVKCANKQKNGGVGYRGKEWCLSGGRVCVCVCQFDACVVLRKTDGEPLYGTAYHNTCGSGVCVCVCLRVCVLVCVSVWN